MPYIPEEDRESSEELPMNAGQLNYAITTLVQTYIEGVAYEQDICQPVNYQLINDVLGALEGAKLEFYRRVAAPYEGVKCSENGDIPLYEDTGVWAGKRLVQAEAVQKRIREAGTR